MNEFLAHRMNWVVINKLYEKLKVNAKIRYNFHEKPAEIIPIDDDTVKIIFEKPQKAVTPGQAVVFYKMILSLAVA